VTAGGAAAAIFGPQADGGVTTPPAAGSLAAARIGGFDFRALHAKRSLSFTVTNPNDTAVEATLALTARYQDKVGKRLRSRTLQVARGRIALPAKGRRKVTLKLSRAAAVKLRKASHPKISLSVTVAGGGRTAAHSTAAVRLPVSRLR
jgi:hypothetical protein